MNALIQYQDYTGVWVTVITTENHPVVILQEMKALKASMPDRKVRAVTENGQLLDFLP